MKRFLLATAGMAALAAAIPASAQTGGALQAGIESLLGGGGGANIDAQLNNLNLRIQTSLQRGDISRTEAARLQGELADLSRRDQSYRSGGLSRAERSDLQQRLQVLDGRIQQASYDGNNRDDRYDRDDREGRYDRDDRDSRYDRDGRDDRDGRWTDNDNRNGRDGCPPGLAKKNNGCQPPGQAMRMGDRYSNQYARVPASYGARYRDTPRYIYRYNDGRIYQVDRRTNLVVRVTATRR
jgi:hypothetical protein